MRTYAKLSAVALILVLIPVVALAASNGMARPVEAAPVTTHADEPGTQQWFACYDGIEGESGRTTDPDRDGISFCDVPGDETKASDDPHNKWIDVLSIDWGSNKPGGGATGQARRRGSVVVEDLTLTMEYEKASVKLLEKLNMGEVIPKLEIEQTANYGGSRATYIKYELKNVQVTSWHVNGAAEDGSPPTVTIGNNFEEYKVTYTEYDSEGNKGGNAETTWKVEKGEK